MNCIVAQSGGPTAAINATLAGVIKGAFINNFDNVYGSVNGIEGILNDNIVNLNVFTILGNIALYLALILTVFSGGDYLIKGWKKLIK